MLRVAVAEDNPKDRERLLSFLKQYGEEKHVQIEVTEYTDGSELLEQYRPCYDVIFLDVEMPQMDGMKAAEKIPAGCTVSMGHFPIMGHLRTSQKTGM